MNENIFLYLIAYLLGAIPFGLLLAKGFGGVDIRAAGSKSIGATNVLRVLKEQNPRKARILAIITLACDALKAFLPLIIAKYAINADYNVLWAMGVLAVIGHCYSPYLGFNGGKGVATGAGVMAFFLPVELICALIAWYLTGKIFKISSLASLCALIVFLASSFILHYDLEPINTHAPLFIICFIILAKHSTNIARLTSGAEKKVI